MSDNTVLKLSQPSTFSDPLTEVVRSGARSLLARAAEAEVAAFLDGHSEARTEEGRRRLVRHGHLPEREIMTGIGPVAVRAPRVRDRTGQGADRIRFSSALLPPYARRSKSLEVLIPVLYLKDISTGDFAEALAALLGAGRRRPVGLDCRAAHRGLGGRARALAEAGSVGRRRMHDGVDQTARWLGQVLDGWLNYFAVPTSRYLGRFVQRLKVLWLRTLRRRSQKDRYSGDRMERLTAKYWPTPEIRHPWPSQRFAVN